MSVQQLLCVAGGGCASAPGVLLSSSFYGISCPSAPATNLLVRLDQVCLRLRKGAIGALLGHCWPGLATFLASLHQRPDTAGRRCSAALQLETNLTTRSGWQLTLSLTAQRSGAPTASARCIVGIRVEGTRALTLTYIPSTSSAVDVARTCTLASLFSSGAGAASVAIGLRAVVTLAERVQLEGCLSGGCVCVAIALKCCACLFYACFTPVFERKREENPRVFSFALKQHRRLTPSFAQHTQTEMADRGLFPSHMNVQSDGYIRSTANLAFWPPFLPNGNPLVESFSSGDRATGCAGPRRGDKATQGDICGV